ncbi:zinc finger protein 345-like [Ochlerotatus camptorhynchus]|uniref:zinc finger protein 345-like n=1 Tax=Ochlerotatus camptorhynchus TaxID=644619 RepID=UPI0031D3F558
MDYIENICRICLGGGSMDIDFLLVNIFESQNDISSPEFSIAELLQTICGLELSEDDFYPKNICSMCLSRLEEAYRLRQQSQQSQEALYDMLFTKTATSELAFEVNVEELDDGRLYEVEYLDEQESLLLEIDVDDQSDVKIEDVLSEQVIDHTNHQKVLCCGCDAAFETERQLRKHSFSKHRPRGDTDISEGKVHCHVCYALFSNEYKLDIHRAGKHNVPPLKKCKFCGCNFFSSNGLLQHKRTFHEDRMYKCCGCRFSCFEKEELLCHSVNHRSESIENYEDRPYQCVICLSRFQTLQERRTHERFPYRMLSARQEEKDEEVTVTVLRCCGCAKVFSLMSELNSHQEEIHLPQRIDCLEEMPIECGGCYKRFKNNSFLNKHLRRAADKKLYACSKCSVARRTLKELIEHEATHTGQSAFICCGCRKRFESQHALEQHSIEEHANRPKVYYNDEQDTERPFECKICYRRYKSARDLRGHQRFVYYEKVHVCDTCGKGFAQENSLDVHMATHKTKAEFPCPICGKKYKHGSNVRNCMVRHERPKQHKCKICNVTFPAASNLYSHMISHSEDRRYKCDVCGQSFKRSFHLRKHMNTHTSEKNYPCKYCSSKFCSTTELYKHEIRHTGMYPYECEICDKKLTTRQVFIKHYESHVEEAEKVFQCNLCPLKYSQDHFLSNHIKYKHRIEPQDKHWNDKFNRKGPNRLKGGIRWAGVRGKYSANTSPLEEEIEMYEDEQVEVEAIESIDEVETKVNHK